MSRFGLLKPAVVLAGMLGIASVLGACGSSHHTASPPPASVRKARRPPPSTTTAPVRRHKGTTTSTTTAVATSGAPVTTAPPTTAPPPASTSVATPPATSLTTTTVAPTPTTAPAPPTAPPPTTAPPTIPPPPTTARPPTTAAAPSGPVRVLADCQTPSYEPVTIILACGDGGITATRIQWSSWGPTSATGTAVILATLCNPNCAQGSSGSFPASITLSDATAAGSSGELFSTLTATFTGASPTGTPTETYSIGAIS